jgi:SAM-dependent methyltransferase
MAAQRSLHAALHCESLGRAVDKVAQDRTEGAWLHVAKPALALVERALLGAGEAAADALNASNDARRDVTYVVTDKDLGIGDLDGQSDEDLLRQEELDARSSFDMDDLETAVNCIVASRMPPGLVQSQQSHEIASGIGAISVRPGQILQLHMKWAQQQLRFQLCGYEPSALLKLEADLVVERRKQFAVDKEALRLRAIADSLVDKAPADDEGDKVYTFADTQSAGRFFLMVLGCDVSLTLRSDGERTDQSITADIERRVLLADAPTSGSQTDNFKRRIGNVMSVGREPLPLIVEDGWEARYISVTLLDHKYGRLRTYELGDIASAAVVDDEDEVKAKKSGVLNNRALREAIEEAKRKALRAADIAGDAGRRVDVVLNNMKAIIEAGRRILLACSGPAMEQIRDQDQRTAMTLRPQSLAFFPMVNDTARNDAFACAIMTSMTRRNLSLVLDIGCGTGFLSLLAAKAGARQVIAVDAVPHMAELAKSCARAHGFEQTVRVIHCHSSQLSAADFARDGGTGAVRHQRADLLIVDMFGSDPLCEGLLPTVIDARARLLTPDAVIIPHALKVYVALLQSDELMHLNSASKGGGFDLSTFNALSSRTRTVRLSSISHKLLTQPSVAISLQLDGDEPPPSSGETQVEVRTSCDGYAHAVVAWFDAQLTRDGGGASISTAPGVADPLRGQGWGQFVWYLPKSGMAIKAGKLMVLQTKWAEQGLSFSVSHHTGFKEGQSAMDTANIARGILIGGSGGTAPGERNDRLNEKQLEARRQLKEKRRLIAEREQREAAAAEAALRQLGSWKTQITEEDSFDAQMETADKIRQLEQQTEKKRMQKEELEKQGLRADKLAMRKYGLAEQDINPTPSGSPIFQIRGPGD